MGHNVGLLSCEGLLSFSDNCLTTGLDTRFTLPRYRVRYTKRGKTYHFELTNEIGLFNVHSAETTSLLFWRVPERRKVPTHPSTGVTINTRREVVEYKILYDTLLLLSLYYLSDGLVTRYYYYNVRGPRSACCVHTRGRCVQKLLLIIVTCIIILVVRNRGAIARSTAVAIFGLCRAKRETRGGERRSLGSSFMIFKRLFFPVKNALSF